MTACRLNSIWLKNHLGSGSPVAQKVIPWLAKHQNENVLPIDELSAVKLAALSQKPAWQRWQRNLSLVGHPPSTCLFAVQSYSLYVCNWLTRQVLAAARVRIDNDQLSSASQTIRPAEASPANSFFEEAGLAAKIVFPQGASDNTSSTCDIFKDFYQELIPREVRHALGEYYTPDWLADFLFQQTDPELRSGRIVDPACGSGTFLLQAIAHQRRHFTAQGLPPEEQLKRLLQNIVGIDIHPLAIQAAHLNYLLAVIDLISPETHLPPLPIFQADSILLSQNQRTELGLFDLIIGNPPWVGWETLPLDYREKTRASWQEQGLFSHHGMATILGGGKKDLSMLLSYVASEQLLRSGGQLAFLTTQAVFKTSAGAGFRRFLVGPSATPVKVERLVDLSGLHPFPGAATRTVCFVWRKGLSTTYPVPCSLWLPKKSHSKTIPAQQSLAEVEQSTQRLSGSAYPGIATDPTSPWLTVSDDQRESVQLVLGPSAYRAHEGANTGGANAVYWFTRSDLSAETSSRSASSNLVTVRNIVAGAKRAVEQLELPLESSLLYPLLHGRDVRRWSAHPRDWILLVQDPISRKGIDEAHLRRHYPHAYQYLCRFQTMLRERAAFKRYFTRTQQKQSRDVAPFYSMFDVGRYTFVPYKVVWHRMLAPLQAAAVGTFENLPLIPQETLAFIPCDSEAESHYLAGLLNSDLFNQAAAAFSPAGGKNFATPKLISHLQLPRFCPQSDVHQALAAESHRLADLVAAQPPRKARQAIFSPDQSTLDNLAEAIWRMEPETE